MPKPSKKVRKTRAKAKNVTQTVIVNVGKRGGSKASTAPPIRSTPTPLQQALQLLQTQRQPAQGESLIQSTQVLQRMLEPINRQLEVLMKQPVPAINIAQPAINVTQPPISITQPPISITQPAISFPPINFPPISISQTMPQAMLKPQASMASMASQTEVVAPPARPAPPVEAPPVEGIKPFPPYQLPQTPLSYRDYVLDLPDAPLVQPAKPLVPGGSLRLDPEHEDVPIVEAEEKEAERPQPTMSIDYEELISTIRESEGAEGNKKRLPGQYTKKELIDMVTSVTGQRFSPSLKNPYYRIKAQAIDFIKTIMNSK
jgi:hypothetical protein